MAKKTATESGVGSTPAPTPTPFDQDKARVAAITKRLMGESDTKSSSLPFADEVQAELIERANELRKSISEQEKALKEIKDELIATCISAELPGLRTDSASIIVNIRSRETLNKDRLLTKITAQELAECYEQGAQYYEGRLQDIKGAK